MIYLISTGSWSEKWLKVMKEGQQYENHFSGKRCEMSKSREKGDQREKEQKAIHFKQTAHN